MSQQVRDRLSKIGLGVWFAAFLVFLYGPVLVMLVLSLQSEKGGSGFPAVGVPSGYWYNYLTGPELGRDPLGRGGFVGARADRRGDRWGSGALADHGL